MCTRGASRCRAESLSAASIRRSRSSSTDSGVSRAATEPAPLSRSLSIASNLSIASVGDNLTDHHQAFADSLFVAAAAVSLTDQHGIYNEAQLCEYVACNFPQVPAIARKYLVIGATLGLNTPPICTSFGIETDRLKIQKNVVSPVRPIAHCHFGQWDCDQVPLINITVKLHLIVLRRQPVV
jgi:hypothetical protein